MRCGPPTSTRCRSAANCRAPAPTGWRAARRSGAAAVKLDDELAGSYILAADTVVAVGRRILPKAELLDEAAQCLRLLSGRSHRVYTGICLVTPKEAFRQRLVETRVRFKRLSDSDIEAYLASGEWRGKAGGYAAQGLGRQLHRQDRRLLHQHRRPAALRDRAAAVGRGLPRFISAGSTRCDASRSFRGAGESFLRDPRIHSHRHANLATRRGYGFRRLLAALARPE
jgi:hypothetical protein